MTPQDFKSIRKAAGLNQHELAAVLRVSPRAVQSWEAPDTRADHRQIPGPVSLLMEILPRVLDATSNDA